MQQSVIGFHTDDEQHWVADLACGHTQHIRHQPPWQNRAWMISEEGRRQHVGMFLECRKCEEASSTGAVSDQPAG